MSINITDGFNINFAAPVDYRMVTANSTTRLAIAYKYDGLKVFQLDNRVSYIWNSGGSGNWDVENSDKISGSGTTNYIPKFTSTGQIGTSSIYVNGNNVGIGTNNPKEYLQIGSFPVSYPGQSLPLVFHKGGITAIGHNWYFEDSLDKSFDNDLGSSVIIFDNDLIEFLHKEAYGIFKTSLYLNSSGNVLIGTNTPTQIWGTSNLFPNSYSKLDIITGESSGSYQELMTLRHNMDSSVALRRLGYIMKMSDESSEIESNKMGGMVLSSTYSYADNPSLHLVTNNENRLSISSGGNVGIGVDNPTYKLTVSGLVQGSSVVSKTVGGRSLYVGSSIWGSDVHLLTGIVSGSNNGFIQVTSGDVGYAGSNIGTNPYPLEIQPGGGQTILPNGSVSLPALRFPTSGNTGFYSPATNVLCFGVDGYQRFRLSTGAAADFTFNAAYGPQALGVSVYPSGYTVLNLSGGLPATSMDITGYTALMVYGNLGCSGSLSKGSGSFRIDHPIESMKDKYDLVHSFIEGPKADLIYRGKVTLDKGRSEVNLDISSDMTEGTFVLLNRDVQCFTTNETGWTPIKGKVTGNILEIVSESNTCSDEISWMVIGERHDKHMYDTEWTDDNGRVIVEPLKKLKEELN